MKGKAKRKKLHKKIEKINKQIDKLRARRERLGVKVEQSLGLKAGDLRPGPRNSFWAELFRLGPIPPPIFPFSPSFGSLSGAIGKPDPLDADILESSEDE